MYRTFSPVLPIAIVAGFAVTAHAQTLGVVSHTPAKHAPSVDRSSPITVTFDAPVSLASLTPSNFRVFGKASGPIAGTITLDGPGTTATFTPNQPYKAGEVVLVTMSRNIARAAGGNLRTAGYHFEFNARAGVSNYQFQQIGSISNRDATGAQTRIYGGIAADFNRDGFTDIATINEVSADLRVLLNTQNTNAPFASMLTPYTSIPYESSPNMPADFNSDGFIDIVISDYDQRIAVALGNGNGGFTSVQEIIVSQIPRDFGIFDADGDGDYDITVACAGGNAINYLANNGN
ncbi:MAG TPA: FG-GAP-like repeat-containing protein, partial [Phycisphaerales bacterium]|nr:FG-GAP-like repeat-containing protein [Phycisphaerales bacterium]